MSHVDTTMVILFSLKHNRASCDKAMAVSFSFSNWNFTHFVDIVVIDMANSYMCMMP